MVVTDSLPVPFLHPASKFGVFISVFLMSRGLFIYIEYQTKSAFIDTVDPVVDF